MLNWVAVCPPLKLADKIVLFIINTNFKQRINQIKTWTDKTYSWLPLRTPSWTSRSRLRPTSSSTSMAFSTVMLASLMRSTSHYSERSGPIQRRSSYPVALHWTLWDQLITCWGMLPLENALTSVASAEMRSVRHFRMSSKELKFMESSPLMRRPPLVAVQFWFTRKREHFAQILPLALSTSHLTWLRTFPTLTKLPYSIHQPSLSPQTMRLCKPSLSTLLITTSPSVSTFQPVSWSNSTPSK